MLSLICNRMEVQGRPTPHRDGSHYTFTCDEYDCDMNSGPVCGIDAAGFPRMFENRCLAESVYCREGRCMYIFFKYLFKKIELKIRE